VPRDNILRFQVSAADGRCSDVWRVWNIKNDVYLAPRSKGGEFKISLHQSGVWRLAFTGEYTNLMRKLGTWTSDRKVESLNRPPEHAKGFTRAIRLYFPDSELRVPPQQPSGPVARIPGPSKDGVRIADFVLTSPKSRFTQSDPPLSGSLGAKPLARWMLPNDETLWVVHFELEGARGLDRAAAWFRQNVARAKKLDDRSPLRSNDSSGRIMIAGTNDQGWFCVIDGALSL
jgi:hypothetical protein